MCKGVSEVYVVCLESLSKAAKKNARRHAAKRAKRFSEEPTREGECEASVEKENMESTAAEDNSGQNEGTVCEETNVIPSVTSSVTLSIDEEIAEVKKQLDEAKAAQVIIIINEVILCVN